MLGAGGIQGPGRADEGDTVNDGKIAEPTRNFVIAAVIWQACVRGDIDLALRPLFLRAWQLLRIVASTQAARTSQFAVMKTANFISDGKYQESVSRLDRALTCKSAILQ